MRSSPLCFALSLLFVISGCAKSDKDSTGEAGAASANLCAVPDDTTAAVVEAGVFKVTEADLKAEMAGIPPRARARYETDKGRQDMADRILMNKALFAQAEKSGLTADPTHRAAARSAAEKAYVGAYLKTIEADAADEASIQEHYNQNKAKWQKDEARARHILVKDGALARTIRAELEAGGDFAALAEKHSEDRGSKRRGGELPWASRERWVKEFAEAAFALELNQVSEPVKSKFGFHIIQLLERRSERPLDEVKASIERVLTRNAVREYKTDLKKELGIQRAPGGDSPVDVKKLPRPTKPAPAPAPKPDGK